MDPRATKRVSTVVLSVAVLLAVTGVVKLAAGVDVGGISSTKRLTGDALIAGRAQIRNEDLSSQWTEVGFRVASTEDLRAPDPCLGDPSVWDLTAGVVRDFSYKNVDGTEFGHLVVLMSVSPTIERNVQREAVYRSELYPTCESERLKGVVADLYPGAVIDQSLHERVESSSPNVVAHRFAFHFDAPGYRSHWAASDDFMIFEGRLKAHLVFTRCNCDEDAPADREPLIVEAVARHMKMAQSTPVD